MNAKEDNPRRDFWKGIGFFSCLSLFIGMISAIITADSKPSQDTSNIFILFFSVYSLFFIIYIWETMEDSFTSKIFNIGMSLILFFICFLAGAVPISILIGFSHLAGMGPG